MQVNINFKAIAGMLGTIILAGIGWWMATVWGAIDSINDTVVELEKRDVTIVLHSKALDDALDTIKDLDDQIEDLQREVAILKMGVGIGSAPVEPSLSPPPRSLRDYSVDESDINNFRAEQRALPPISEE